MKVKEKYLDLLDKSEKLKKLCDMYEEEHNNEFKCWKKDRRELLDKRQIIEKAIEYIKIKAINNCMIDQYESCEIIKILKGEENE